MRTFPMMCRRNQKHIRHTFQRSAMPGCPPGLQPRWHSCHWKCSLRAADNYWLPLYSNYSQIQGPHEAQGYLKDLQRNEEKQLKIALKEILKKDFFILLFCRMKCYCSCPVSLVKCNLLFKLSSPPFFLQTLTLLKIFAMINFSSLRKLNGYLKIIQSTLNTNKEAAM